VLARFVAAFKRGIEGELAAMRTSSDASEIALTRGEDLGGLRYAFHAASDKLAPGSAAQLRTSRGEQRVIVERIVDTQISILATQAIDVAEPASLVVAPWFLYDRLLSALDGVETAEVALRMFGKAPHANAPTTLRADHAALDASQRAAVQLCSDSNLAFIWGPPGTGKTVTLASVVAELLAQGQRILLVSTTNAAIDQVLAKLAAKPGIVVRLGRSDAETYGAEIGELVDTLGDAHRRALERLRTRIGEVEQQTRYAQTLVAELAIAVAPQQSLFAPPAPRLRAGALARLFSAADAIADLDAKAQLRVVELRIARLERVRALAKKQVAIHAAANRDLEAKIVADARVVMCTLATAYLSPLMTGQRFDALIAEEAGMATLPPLFYAASLCTQRAIVVGDPRQLPPIVQSDDELVRRSIGRNIFDVAIPDPLCSPVVAMLEVQYRMHPAIGAIVGKLFYADRLVHRADGTEAIAALAPFPGMPVTVVDVPSRCERKGTSRVNPTSARVTADLALQARRAGATSIGVITPYAAQAAEIRARLDGDDIECSTIHRYQGRECDVVILDLVDAAPMQPGVLLTETLLNVSISRARGKLVIVADTRYFTSGIVATLLRAIPRA
jgi:hypothetical protein